VSGFVAPVTRVDRVYRGKPTHHYEDANGRKMPGVTSILSAGLPKPALVNWAGNATAEAAVNRWDELGELPPADRLKALKAARYEERDAAARRGTEVHALAEKLVLGEEVTVPDELRGHVESYLGFLDDWQPVPLYVESTVVNYTHGYAGSLDLIGGLYDGTVFLGDVKTNRSGIFPEVALQLAAYRYAEFILTPEGEEPMPRVDVSYALWIRSDGYSVVPVDTSLAVFDDFRRVAATARAAERLGSYLLPELTAPAPQLHTESDGKVSAP